MIGATVIARLLATILALVLLGVVCSSVAVEPAQAASFDRPPHTLTREPHWRKMLEQIRSQLRDGWFLHERDPRTPPGDLALGYSFRTKTTRVRGWSAVDPRHLALLPRVFPEAFKPSLARSD
jgi:hypothetical protein